MTRSSRSVESIGKTLNAWSHPPLYFTRRTCLRAARNGPSQLFTRRQASSLTSTTAINASKNIPYRYRELYAALEDVQRKASTHVSLSRLQLALQGLESDTPRIRVAVLGLNVIDTARRVVRLLLADALEQKQSWERELLGQDVDYNQGVLIRYGQSSNTGLPSPKTSIPTLHVNSPLLERQNIEILVSSIGGLRNGNAVRTTPVEAFLAPTIGTPTASSGRQTLISQPVHGSLVVAKGLPEFLEVSELLASTAFVSNEERALVSVALEQEAHGLKSQGDVLVLDTVAAEDGLAAIRKSLSGATEYERKWTQSGMLAASGWVTTMSQKSDSIPPAVMHLTSTMLDSATRSLQAQEALDVAAQEALGLSLAATSNLEAAIDNFSRNAHQELQSGLSSAWSSSNWRKLAWYKLFWRVDDVGLIVSDLVNNAWLPLTERAVFELSGHLSQAGISPIDIAVPPSTPGLPETRETVPSTVPLTVLASADSSPAQPVITTDTTGQPHVELQPLPRPVPISSLISSSRANTVADAILTLQSQAQQLVLRTLSISGLSAGLSGLTYFSLTPGSLYEAGTIFALGTVFALYRMQGGWNYVTTQVEAELFERGRNIINEVTGKMRALVESAKNRREDNEVVRRREEAAMALTTARDALEKLSEAPDSAKVEK